MDTSSIILTKSDEAIQLGEDLELLLDAIEADPLWRMRDQFPRDKREEAETIQAQLTQLREILTTVRESRDEMQRTAQRMGGTLPPHPPHEPIIKNLDMLLGAGQQIRDASLIFVNHMRAAQGLSPATVAHLKAEKLN